MEDPIKDKAALEARLASIQKQISVVESGTRLRFGHPEFSADHDTGHRIITDNHKLIGVSHDRMKSFALDCLRAAEVETEAKIHALRFEIVRFANEQLARVSAEIAQHNKGRM